MNIIKTVEFTEQEMANIIVPYIQSFFDTTKDADVNRALYANFANGIATFCVQEVQYFDRTKDEFIEIRVGDEPHRFSIGILQHEINKAHVIIA